MALPTFKDIAELFEKGATLEAQHRIIELHEACLAAREENIKLREQIGHLETLLNRERSLIWEPPFYYIEANGKRDGPFCQKCYDEKDKLIRLQSGYGMYEGSSTKTCLACSQGY